MRNLRQFFLTTLVLLGSALTSWAQQFSFGGLQYEPTSVVYNYVSVIKCFRTTGALTIPSTVVLYGTTYTVNSIGSSAFENCSGLTEVTIPESVTSIGSNAFSGCSGLTEITIPNSVTSIYGNAFSGCSGLTEVTIPESVTSIGSSAFSGCSGLTKITLPFTGDKPHTATDQYQYPFGYIFGTSSYPDATETTQEYYGSSTSSTTSTKYYIPTSLKEVVITGSSYIPYGAFYGCSNLTSVTIPESVTSIGSSAFYGCSGLTKITLPFTGDKPHTATDQYQYPFGFIFGESSYTSATATTQLYYYGSSTSSWTRTTYYIPTSLKEVVITGCSHIPYGAFYNCSGLTEVTIGNSVTSIGGKAFGGCSGLTEVTIGNSVTTIGEEAFRGCSGLTEVTIPESVTTIGEEAFRGCSGLTEITIPNSVTSIGSSAFSGCSGLTEVTIPNSVTSISSSAFNGCSGLTSITIPNSITSIGYSAFGGCSGLTEVTIPESVTLIDNYAFSGCSGLTEVTIPNSVTSIGQYAFNGCSGLTEVTIPNSVTSIGNSAFWGCIGLTKITLPFVGNKQLTASETNQYPLGYIFGTSEYTGGTETTQEYHGSSTIYITSTKYYIPTSLKEVVITGSSYIPYGAFYGCSKLTSITIPSSVTSVGDKAFYSCSKAKEIVFEGETVPTFGTSVFYSSNNCPIYVPTAEAVTAYKGATNMNNYASRVKVNPVRTITVEANNADYGTVTGGGKFDTRTTTSTEISAAANEHYQFVSWSDGKTNNPRTITISGDATYTAIFKRVLTVSDIVVANKEYDGTTEATVSSYQTDKLESDDVTVIITASFNTASAGANKEVSYNIELGGTDADKYVLASTAGTTTADITAISVSNPTIELSATSFTYNGSAQTPTVTVKDGETTIDPSEYTVTMTTDVTNVGEKTVTISDNEGGNYTVSGSATFVINPKQVSTPTITLSATSFTYNGSAQTPTVSSVKDGSTTIPTTEYTVNFPTDATSAGQKTVTITDKTNGNYNVSGSATYTINPKVVSNPTITLSATSFTYNGSAQKPSVTSVKDGETTINASEYTIGYSDDVTNAGQKTVTITDKANGNYAVSGSANFTIDAKEVSLAWSNTSLIYNGSEQCATATAEGLVNGDVCTVNVIGAKKDQGTYAAEAESLSNANYKLPDAKTTQFTIAPKEVSLAWSNTALTYNGENQVAAATAEGLIGEDVCTVTVEGAEKNVGNYTATATALSNDNYKLPEAASQAFAIAPKEVTLAWSNTTLTYNGNEQIATATAEGLFGDDACVVTVEGAAKNVGTHTATAKALDNDNYKLPAVVTSNFKIEPKEVSLVWSNTSLIYNGAEQVAIATVEGLETGDECTVTVSGEQTNAGTYTATAESLSNSNYTLPEATTCEFTIAPKTGVVVTVTENSKEVVYNTEEQSVEGYTVSISDELGIYSVDDFTFSGTAIASGTTVGEYAMNLSTTDFENTNTNFAGVQFEIVDGALTITKAPEAPNKPEATIETQYIVTQLVALPDDWKWADEQQALEEGDNTATANYTGADKGNYEVESVAVSIKRLPCPHNEGNEMLYTLEATCTHKGYTGNHSCKLCGQIYLYGDSIPALGHAYDTVIVAVTCAADGYKELTCTRCGDITHIDIVPATGHTDSVAYEHIVAATCTVAGSQDSVVYCSVCKEELSRKTVEIEATGHTAAAAVAENLKPATCTEAGSVDSVVYCSVCNTEISRKTVEIKATSHTAAAAVAENLKPATCTEAGSVDSVVYCSVCNTEISRKTVEIKATGHTAGEAVAENLKAATCTEAGSVDSVVYCSVCNTEISRKTVEIKATGHTAGEAGAENLKAATCTEAGSVDSVVYCSVCNAEISRKTVEIPATGHIAGEAVIENVVAATYTAAGSYDSVVYCTVCHTELSRVTIDVPQLVKPTEAEVVEVVISQVNYTVGDSLNLEGGKLIFATSDSTTAEVVITPEMISGFNPDSVGVQTVTVSFEIDGVPYTTTFDVTVKDIAKPIEAEVVISQINYTVGDSLKLDGGKLIFATSDSTTAEVVITPEMVSGFNPDSVGVQMVTVSFEIDGVPYTTTFEVEVKEAEVIEVVAKSVVLSAPTKVVYKKGEQLDVAGGKLTVTYSDGTTQVVELKADMVSGFDAEKVGTQKLTATLKIDEVTLTATFDVTVEADNTAISDDEAAAVNIYAYDNTIVVENAVNDIYVYDAMGKLVVRRDDVHIVSTEIRINRAGVYIVKTGTTAKRVMIND